MRKRLNILLIFSLLFFAACNGSSSKDGPKATPIPNENPFDPSNPGQCLAIDTDGDGLIDCKDPDIDGDGHLNEVDAFPYDPTEWLDTDGDDIGDNADRFPLDPTEWGDNDNDGIGDNADSDDDNDGVPDLYESFLFDKNPNDWIDVDGDRLGLSIDEDDDNDGVPNVFDDLRWNAAGGFDIDRDLVPNSQDSDMDGDGIANLVDAFPYDSTEWVDTDLDRLGNNIDPDDDNDGFPDSWEDFPLDKDYSFDTDGDGYANEVDAFPYDPNEWVDSDNDGIGDNSDPFPFNSNEWADTDRDGIGDNSDADIDNDGFKNCVPLDLNGPAHCNQDAFPLDPTEWVDTDGDGVGDNADADDDNDGIPDRFDSLPKESLHFSDFDQDSMPDSTFPATPSQAALLPPGHVFFVYDEDSDNDGCPNMFEDLPYDRFDCFDLDGDNIGTNRDSDRDGDGVLDIIDIFPYDPSESADNDLDGLGDNIDHDDDNDGVPDIFDSLPFNKNGFSDYNGDGIPDEGSLDIDGDGKINGIFECEYSNVLKRGYSRGVINPAVSKEYCTDAQGYRYPFHSCDIDYGSNYYYICSFKPIDLNNLNQRADLYPFDSNEWQDLDFDDLADNLVDSDDDNDGVPDFADEFPNDVRSERKFSFTDLDKDGTPSHTYLYHEGTSTWMFAFDPDIDGDGVDDGAFSCTPRANPATTIDCVFQKSVQELVENPRGDVPGEPEFIQATRYFDAFPYDPNETSDYDGDGIGDNRDVDADGDGHTNCIPISMDATLSCNVDELPLVGLEDPFRSAKYYPFDDSNLSAVSYCVTSDCHYKNYDRDSDGLTDYEEYLIGSNPEDPDTDEDGVPDLVERDQGTDPNDENDYLDSDGDGIPDFADKTPKGAHDEASLRNQITNAASCQPRQYEEVCVDSQTDLCQWVLTEPPQFVPNPNNPSGPQIPAGTCVSKDILITKDIDLTDCLSITGEVNIRGKSRYTLNFPALITQGPNCSSNGINPIKLEADSVFKLENVHLQSNFIDQLIDSEGYILKLIDTSVMLENTNLPGIIKFNQPGNGVLNIHKSTLVTKLEGSQAPSSMNSAIEANIRSMNLNSVIIDCDVEGRVDDIPSGFICVNTQVDTSIANYVGVSISANGEAENPNANIIAWQHFSDITTVWQKMIQGFSPYQGIKLDGLGLSYTPAQVVLSDRSSYFSEPVNENDPIIKNSQLKVNGVNVQVGALQMPSYGQIIASPIPYLQCSEKDFELGVDPYSEFHPYYFAPTPLDTANLTKGTIQTFNSFSLNLTQEGSFVTVNDFNAWNNMIGKTSADLGMPILTPSVYEDGKARLSADGSDGSGIGRYLGLAVGRKYKISFRASAVDGNDKNINLDFKLFEGASGKVIKLGKINYKTNENQVDSYDPNLNLYNFYVDYNESLISFNFTLESGTVPNDIGFYIKNNEYATSKPVYIDDITVQESSQYEIQWPGISVPVCSE